MNYVYILLGIITASICGFTVVSLPYAKIKPLAKVITGFLYLMGMIFSLWSLFKII